MVYHLGASVGSTAPVKWRRVLNDPKGLLGADLDQIPVSIILFDVLVRTAFFLFCGRCNTGEITSSPYRVFRFMGDVTQVDPAA